MIVTKPIDLELLASELAAASVVVGPLGLTEVSATESDLHTYNADGASAELPPLAWPVVEAHVAPPRIVDYAGSHDVDAVIRTTDAAPREVFRIPTQPKHVYKATLEMMAVDAVSGATKNTEAKMTFKRPSTTLVQVGSTSIPYNAPDTATASWTITPSVTGTDLVISVSGAAGRTVDWILKGQVAFYAPEGLA